MKGKKARNISGLSQRSAAREAQKMRIFPVFPCFIRVNETRDWFATNCYHHQYIKGLAKLVGKYQKPNTNLMPSFLGNDQLYRRC